MRRDLFRPYRIWRRAFIVWAVCVCAMWAGAIRNPWAALIAVPIAAATGLAMGHSIRVCRVPPTRSHANPYRTLNTMGAFKRYAAHWETARMKGVPYFKLEGHDVVPLPGPDDWMEWRSTHRDECKVMASTFGPVEGDDACFVSTVFIGIGHISDMQGRPLVFETMIFGSPLAGHEEHSATYDDAVIAHELATQMVKAMLEGYHAAGEG